MSLCGMLAADYTTPPTAMRAAMMRFFDDNDAWLTGVIEQAGWPKRSGSRSPVGGHEILRVDGREPAR